MKHHTKALALWVGGVLAVVGVAIMAHCAAGCAESQSITKVVDDTAACESEMSRTVIEAANCNEAQFKVDAVIATTPACKGYPHFEVCALLDGGSHD